MNAVARPVPFVQPARRAPALGALRKQCGALGGWVPFTQAFNNHVTDTVDRRMAEFHELDLLTADERAEIEERVRVAEEKFAHLDRRRRGTATIIVALSIVFVLVYQLLVIPRDLVEQDRALRLSATLTEHAVLLWAGGFGCLILTLMGALALVRAVRRRFGERDADRTAAAVIAVMAASVATGVATAWRNGVVGDVVDPVVYLALLAMAWLGVLALTAAATWVVVQQARRMYQTRTAMAWPESTAIHQFVSILVALRRAARAQWLELEERRELIGSLECAATCIERYLPGRLRHADDATDRWLRGRTQAIAASLRDLKRGLCLPRASARDEVAKRVAAALLVSARGDWDLLEASAEPVLVEEKRPRSLKALALRGVLGAVLLAVVVWDQGKSPAALLGFADHLLHELNGLVGPLIVPTVGYTLLKLVNPAVLENLSSIRDFGKRKDP